MLKSSFIFLEKISANKEQKIWQQGIKDWNDFIKAEKINGIPKEKKPYYDRKLREAQQELLNDNSEYFAKIFPKKEIWRLYDYFKEQAGFLDIEVDSYGKIILVGISDYYNSNFFVRGINLDLLSLEKELSKFKILVTFNGNSFD